MEDWEEAALDAIAAGGLRSISIPALAATLGVTKGSFYWHFESLEQLIEAALQRWERADRETISLLAQHEDPRQRLRRAFDEAMALDRSQALYVTLAATPDPSVTQVLRRVSRRRIRFLADAFVELGMSESAARRRALVTYTAYLGVIHLRRQSFDALRSREDVAAYVAHAAETFIPSRARSK